MEIQKEFPLPENPLEDLPTDYHDAVLHLAWDWQRSNDIVTLLFAFIELLPAEIPPPIDDYSPKDPACSVSLGKRSDHYVYVRHAVLPATDAVGWYLACRSGDAVLPDEDGGLKSPTTPGPHHLALLGPLGEQPAWPALLSPPDDTKMLPFAPHWMNLPRSHHLVLPGEADLEALWPATSEREKAADWLAGRLHFDLGEYPEYWGSVHLLAPNPVYRKMGSRLQRSETGSESVLVRFQPRAGRSVAGLRLLYQEGDGLGVTSGRVISLGGNLVNFRSASVVHGTSEDVFDDRRGFLHVSRSVTTFTRSINMQFGMSHALRVVGPTSSYIVNRSGEPEVTTVGTPGPTAPGRLRLLSAHYSRESKRDAASREQWWFRGQPSQARATVRRLVSAATETVLFVDPYFGPDELAEYALAIGRTDVRILVLTSAKGLKEAIAKDAALEKGDALVEAVGRLRAMDRPNPLEVRVMTGDDPIIHDRFIVVDARLWHLGASLHDFGVRGTMIMGVPDPNEVRPHLESAWDDAATFHAWFEQRRRERRAPDEGGSP